MNHQNLLYFISNVFVFRHSRESGNPDAVPAKTGNQNIKNWIPHQVRNDKNKAGGIKK